MVEILAWNDDYAMLPDALSCADDVRLVRDRRRLAHADAVIFHLPTLRDAPDPDDVPAGQRWVAWSMESDVNYPVLHDPSYLDLFDLTMTYRRDADVWVPYLAHELLEPEPAPVRTGRPHDTEPAVYIASNPACPSGRDAYVAELMQYLPVASYGACLNNRAWPVDHGRATKLATLARHPFTLAFENSISTDYVTEKFFDAFLAGSVPVYLGAPNVADFAPGLGSFIDVRDFDGPRELATHLRELASDDAAYAEYHAWRVDGPSPEYRALLAQIDEHCLCRLARLLGASPP